MLGPAEIDAIRRMTPGQRLRIGFELIETGWRFLARLTPKERQRRLDLVRRPWDPPVRVRLPRP